MKTSTFKTILLILLVGFTFNMSNAADCLDFNQMSAPVSNYNNDGLYPAGSVFQTSGDLKFIKTKSNAPGPGPWNLTNIIYVNPNDLGYNGYLTFDVSSASYSCRELIFNAYAEKIIIGNDTLTAVNGKFSPYIGSGYAVDTIAGGSVKITGNYNAVTIWNVTGILYSACLNSCASSSNSCLDYRNLIGTSWPGYTGYNNDSLYPAGSTILSAGGVKIIKTYTTGNWNPPYNTYFTASTDTTFDVNGYITLDVSTSTFSCKKLTFTSLYGRPSPFIVDGDTIPYSANPYSGNGFTMNAVGNTFTVSGSFNSISLFAPNLGLGDICLEDCSVSSNCLDFRNLIGTSWPGGTGYNNDSLYPAGSTILSAGDVKIVKTHPYGNWNPPLVTSFAFGNDSSITGDGYMTIDVTSSNYPCKQLSFSTIANTLIINGDTITNFGSTSSYSGSGYNIVVSNMNVVVTGSFNTVILGGPNLTIINVCLDSCASSNSACLDFNLMTAPVVDYNNDGLYPAGSTLLTSGDLKLIKTKTNAPSPGPWNLTNIIYVNPTDIGFNGYLTFDVSAATYSCRELIFNAIAQKIIIGSDTLTQVNGKFSPYTGSSYAIDTIPGGGIKVTGTYNAVTIWIATGIVYDACLNPCSTSTGTCFIANDLDSTKVNNLPGGYNDNNTYPAGSVLATQNNINFIKTFNFNGPSNAFTQFLSLSNGQLIYWGAITLDVSASNYTCKKLTIRASGGGNTKIYADNDTLLTRNGYTVTQIAFDHYEIQGTFNTVTFSDIATSFFQSACLEDCSVASSACIDFQDTTLFITIPTNQNTYGTPWYTKNGVSFSAKYFDYTFFNNPGEVVIGDHVTANYVGANGNTNYVGNIFYQGNAITKVDFTGLALSAKKIEFDVNYILDSNAVNPYYVNGQPVNSLPVGITYLATPLTNGFHIELTGVINTIEIHGFEVGVDNMCIDSMATTLCQTSFIFTVSGQVVTFTNTSSATAFSANQFNWDFGDGSYSSSNDPTHTYANPGTYWVCLTIVDFSCPTNPTMQYCDSVTVGGCSGGHRIITPNGDGQADEVFIPSGSKIYDRNGFLVKSVKQDMNWKGDDDSNRPLPMGYYTITCGNGDGVFNVTIVK